MFHSSGKFVAIIFVSLTVGLALEDGARWMVNVRLRSGIHETVDVFRGSFSSSKEIFLAVDETTEVSFSIQPIMNVRDASIRIFLPGNLVELVEGEMEFLGDVGKDESVDLSFVAKAIKEMEANVRAYVEGYISGQKTKRSYYAKMSTRKIVGGVSSSCACKLESALASSSVNPSSPDPGYITVQGSFWYINDSGGYSPMRHVKVTLWDDDTGWPDWPEGHIRLDETYTDENGYYSFYVENEDGPLQDGLDIYLHVHSETDWNVAVTKTGDETYYAYTDKNTNVPDGVHDFGALYPVQNNEAWEAIDSALTEYQWIQDRTSWRRSLILFEWPEGTWPAHWYSFNTDTGEITNDWIELPDKATANWGHVTVHHEYGHAVMTAAYGWNHYNMPSGWGPSPHYVFSESSQGFAVMEGWAEFMQCVVDNNASNLADWHSGHGGDIETNDWYNCIDTGDIDGDVIEGSIASILWDIWDSPNTEDDGVGLGFYEIWYIMLNHRPKTVHEFWDYYFAYFGMYKREMWEIYYNYGINKPRGHDLIVTSVTPWKTVVGQGFTLKINVTVLNWGDYTEAFNVTTYSNTTIIDILTDIILTSGNSTTITFAWNTTSVAYGNYTISAEADMVPDEADPTDNLLADGMALVTIAGDVDGDGDVDGFDLTRMCGVYGCNPDDPAWDEPCDLNGDSIIDGFDLTLACGNYGEATSSLGLTKGLHVRFERRESVEKMQIAAVNMLTRPCSFARTFTQKECL